MLPRRGCPLCYVEGCLVEDNGTVWAVRGVEHPPGLLTAIPRYRVSKTTETGYRIAWKAPKDPSLLYAYLASSLEDHLIFNRCCGRITSVLRLERGLRFLDPLSPLICEESIKKPPCIVLEHLRSYAEEGLFGLTGSSYFEWRGPEQDVDVLVVAEPDTIGEVARRIAARTAPLSLGEALELVYERGYERFSVEVIERLTASFSLRKVLGYRVFIRYLDTPLWEYRPCRCEIIKLGDVTVKGKIVDARRSFIFPYEYLLEVDRTSAKVIQGEVVRVVSTRAMFAELALEGWLVEVRGDLEARVCDKKVELQVFLWSKKHGITVLRKR